MNNFLVAVAVFLIAVLAAAFTVPRVVHWDSYRGVIEEEATRMLGRDVRVGGGVKIRLLPAPSFSVEKITVADTEAGTGQPFFKADALSGRLAIAPLLRGVFQATDMRMLRPEVRLVLDGNGGGNWKTLGQGRGQLPFQFSDVALDELHISGGVFVVHGPDRAERLRLEAIDGVLSAVALEGPFRFRGSFGVDAEKRDLRVATTRQEADGSIRFKATMQMLDTGAVYNFDARAIDLTRAPRVEGELSAKVAMPSLGSPPPGAKAETKSDPKSDLNTTPLELRAALVADLRSIKLSNLNLSFERLGRPQILTGEATIDVSKTVDIDARLAAKWLDLDQVIGLAPQQGQPAQQGQPQQDAAPKPGEGPIEGLLSLAQRLNGFSPEQGRARLVLDVEQANLGREAVSGLRMTLAGKGAETDIRELRLGLPGGAQADVKGLMTGSGVETSFDGDVVLRGASLARFLGWVSGGAATLDAGRDGAFAMRSKLAVSPGAVTAREFTGELAGTIMQGELGYRWQTRPEVSILIEGPRVDLRPLLGDGGSTTVSLADILAMGSRFGSAARAGRTDAVLRVRAGELVLPGATFVDAAIDLGLRDGKIAVNRLTATGEGGVAIDAEGDFPTTGTNARGTLRGSVAASEPAALRRLAAFLAVPVDLLPTETLATELVPLRLAGTIAFANTAGQPIDLVVEGGARDTRVSAKIRLEQGGASWRVAPLDAAATLSGARAIDLLKRVASIEPTAGSGNETTAAGVSSVTVHVAGVPARGLVTHVSVGDGAPSVSFTGRTELVAGQSVKGEGQIHFDGADVVSTLSLLAPAARVAGARDARSGARQLTGQARVDASNDGLTFDAINVTVGGVGVRGRMSLDAARTTLAGRLALTRVSALSLLSPFATADTADRMQLWPTARLVEQPYGDLNGTVAVSAERIDLPGEIGVERATFDLAIAPGRVEVRGFEGRGAGGSWTGGVKVETGRNGSAATLALRLKDVTTASLMRSDTTPPVVDASMSGALTMTATGTSVRELVAAAAGRGAVAVSDARLTVLPPSGLASILGAVARLSPDQLSTGMRQGVSAFKPTEPLLILPARSVEIDVRSGVIALAPVGVDSSAGQAVGSATIDLKTMTFGGQWRVATTSDPFPALPGWTTTVEAPATPAQRKPFAPLPALTISVAGPLKDMTRAPVFEIASEALEREVAVRRVERDLEELERVRKLDEERAKDERAKDERAKDEAERRSAAEVSPATAPVEAPATPLPAAALPTGAVATPDSVDPAARTKAATPALAAPTPTPAPAPKPALRPMNTEEHRKIFGGG